MSMIELKVVNKTDTVSKLARYRECLDPLRDGKGFDLIHTSIRTVCQYVHQTHLWAWYQKRLTESAEQL